MSCWDNSLVDLEPSKKRVRGATCKGKIQRFLLAEFSDVVQRPLIVEGKHIKTALEFEENKIFGLSVDEYRSFVKWLLIKHQNEGTKLENQEIRLIRSRLQKLRNKSAARVCRNNKRIIDNTKTGQQKWMEESYKKLVQMDERDDRIGLLIDEIRHCIEELRVETRQSLVDIRNKLEQVNTKEGILVSTKCSETNRRRLLHISDEVEWKTEVDINVLSYALSMLQDEHLNAWQEANALVVK